MNCCWMSGHWPAQHYSTNHDAKFVKALTDMGGDWNFYSYYCERTIITCQLKKILHIPYALEFK